MMILDLTARLRLRPPRRKGLALVYHRVSGAPDGSGLLAPYLDPNVLRAQLDHLRANYRVVPPSRLLAAVAETRRGDRPAIAITFDDDLPSHVDTVAPLLRESELSAAFFLCGTALGGDTGLWWEDLEVLAERRRSSPQTSIPDDAVFEPLRRRAPGAIHAVAEQIEELSPRRRDEIAALLRASVGTPPRALDRQGIRTLVQEGFEIGFHTRRHYLLPTLAETELAAALIEGRDALEAVVGTRLTMIAYPHGKADERVADAARGAGYTLGFSGLAQPAGATTDPLLIGRLDAQAVAPADFAATVEATLGR
jgi:peptidoglycan/xylan/chitin deacetylase (PgdA/CDA1 family)